LPREHTQAWLRQQKIGTRKGHWRTRTTGSEGQIGQHYQKRHRAKHVVKPFKTRSLQHKLVLPHDKEAVGPKPREIKPKIKAEKSKKSLFKIGKKPKPRTGMGHLERMHLLSFAKEHELDSQEIDGKIGYYENKAHLEELAKQKGVSEEELHGKEVKIEEDVASHEEYLNNLKNELEEAGYKVELPGQ
jgi:hypothetical protein